MDETVRLEISIQIDEYDNDYDTGYSVAEWNALTDEERSAVYHDAWEAMTAADSGGVRVLTPGAEGL
jgi:hypothetical protein